MTRGAWLAACALAVYLAGVAVWVGYDRRSVREVFPPGSIYATGDQGLSLAYAYLRARAARETPAARVAVLRRPAGAEVLPRRAVVFRVVPTVVPFLPEEKKEKDNKDGKRPSPPAPLPAPPAPRRERGDKKKQHLVAAFLPSPGDWVGGAGRGAGGEGPPPSLLTAAEDAWVRAGGRLVLALEKGYGPLGVEPLPGQAMRRDPVRKVFPLWPGVSELHATGREGLAGIALAGFHAVATAGAVPVIARQTVGAGEVIALSCPEILENRLLGQAHHLALLEALAGLREGRSVFFDERAHGFGDDAGVTEILGSWGLGPLLLLALLAAAAAFWRAAVRIGAPDRDDLADRDLRSDAVELVDSLAELYDRALGRGDAVRLYHESFLHTLAAETGLRGPALEARARELLGGFVPVGDNLPRDRFDRDLRTLNEAFRRLQDAKRT
jgi:hypothetical protein